MAKVLVLDCECAAGVESIQSLGRYGAEVHAASRRDDALGFASKYCSRHLAQPIAPAEFGDWLRALDEVNQYTLIVPATEVSLSALEAAAVPKALRDKAVLPPPESIASALDKEQVWQLASRLGIPVPRSVVQSGGAGEAPFDFPLVVKPVQSKKIEKGVVKEFAVSILRTAKDWNDWQGLQRQGQEHGAEYQVQEYFTGKGIGIELLFRSGQPVWHFAHERLHEFPLTGGGSSYRQSISPPLALLEHSILLLQELRWHGVAMVEWKLDEHGQYKLIEINPRLWGSLALAIDCGVDFPVGLLKIAAGEPLSPQPKFPVGYCTRNLGRDFQWQIANCRADHSNPLLFTRPRLRSLLQIFRPAWGNESWDHFDWRDLAVTRRMLRNIFLQKGSAAAVKLWRAQEEFFLRHGRQRRRTTKIKSAANPPGILFLCYGNICRSPLAERIARRLRPDLHTASAGFHPSAGRLSPVKMIDAARLVGIELESHRSKRVHQQLVEEYSVIVIMDWRNYDLLKRQFPAALSKVVFLGLFAEPPVLQIEDPYDLPPDQVVRVTRQLEGAVTNLLQQLCPAKDHYLPHKISVAAE